MLVVLLRFSWAPVGFIRDELHDDNLCKGETTEVAWVLRRTTGTEGEVGDVGDGGLSSSSESASFPVDF